ncbi:DUF6541 family protein [Actinokineospora bangkokensis]|uniref:Copper-transporting ATPase n=1 Tax=Actinokineospora bangkokensis TaxID=1193682 RepID=A0A1Q9LHA4_9PSEU|nr:DUF6541 family protein [Actinokineospora bangkokensis]OLR91390.1 hypothetical protein BJP25_00655 [Actinokineospora bangkokensis]
MTATHLLGIGSLALVLLVPGLLVGVAAGLRGWVLLGAAPVLTYGVVSVFAPYFPGLLPRWSVWALLLSAAITAAVVGVVRFVAQRWLGRFQEPFTMPSRWSWYHHAGVVLAIGVAAGVGLLVTYRATAGFTGVHQFWDAMFHANATRYISDTGQSAPIALRIINAPDNPDFYYPNTYHVLLATAVQMSGLAIPDAMNIGGGALAGSLALGVAALVRVTSGRPAVAGASALVSCAVGAFPAGLQYFGPLWPFAAGIVVIPAFLALFTTAVRCRQVGVLVATAVGAMGLSALHPSAALAAGVYGGGWLLFRWVGARKVPLREVGALAVMGVVAAVFVVPQFLAATATAGNATVSWPLISVPGQAFGSIMLLNSDTPYPQWWLVVPLVVGLFAVRRMDGLRWLLLGGGFFVALFVLAASYKGFLVRLLTNPWWNDTWRFAGLVAIAQVVVIGFGLVVIRDKVVEWAGRARAGLADSRGVKLGTLAAVVLLLVVGTGGLYRDLNRWVITRAYGDGPTVSAKEREAMDKLRELVRPGELVMNDPQDGSPWMWALDGVQPVFGHAVIPSADYKVIGPDRVRLFEHFDELDDDSAVDAIIRKNRIAYAYIGNGFASPSSKRALGMDALDSARSLKLVYENPDARIYQVVLPGGATPG